MGIDQVGGVRSDISEMLSKIREVSNKSTVFSGASQVKGPSGFTEVMSIAKNAVNQVNNIQAQTEQIRNAYIAGDNNVSLSQVVIASQKSKLAFEGLMTVRNKILEAYKEIMNMPI
ncbi:MAG: flagellar hook-basal body complex protein FliE [Gammaproteobacteria bacterium]